MGSNEERSINHYDFSMSVHEDVDTFLNVHEFAAIHDIDGQKVPCVTLSRKVSDNEKAEGVMTRGLVLYVSDKYVARAESGLNVRIDGRLYVIDNAVNIQGELWRIELVISDV